MQTLDYGKSSSSLEICSHVDPIINQLKFSNILNSAPMHHTEHHHVFLCAYLADFGQPEE